MNSSSQISGTKKELNSSLESQSNNSKIPLAIRTMHLSKIFNNGQQTVALDDVTISIEEGSFVAIVGASGSGKSTLLHLIGGLDRPTKVDGQILEVCGQSLLDRSESWLASFRAQNIGFVLQFFGLLPTITVLENVMLASYFGGNKRGERKKSAEDILKSVDLDDRFNYFPNQLSGGQKQRVAIARALVNNPKILFADEPTGNLDTKNGQEIFDLLEKLNKDIGLTIVIVSHDTTIFNYSSRTIEISDGLIIRDDFLNN
ncbi:MAG: ABC transporter ATP-binding protein [Candidatus Hodarchaeota archaeon]